LKFSIRVTEVGWRVAAVFLVTGSLALLFMDPIIGLVSAGMAGVFAYSYLGLRRGLGRVPGGLRFSPEKVEDSTTVGRVVKERIGVESSLRDVVQLGCSLDDALLDNGEIFPGVNAFNYLFKPRLSGEVSSGSLVAGVSGYLGLCEGGVDVGFGQGFKVYPRVVEVIAEAVEFLASSDVFGSGAQILRLRGGWAEYAESRPYVAGDSMKNLDWKATARFGSLMAKEFYLEGGAEIAVVYDLVAPDSVARDEVAASFLELVLMYARMNYAVGLHVVEGSRAVFSGERLAPQVAVSVALRSVLGSVEVEPRVIYDVLEPGASGVFRRVLELPDPWAEFGGRDIVGAEYVYVDILSVGGVEGMHVSVVSALGDPAPLFGLARYAGGRGWSVTLLQPARPWLSASGLEGAVGAWGRYGRLYSRLEKDGVGVCSSVAEVQRDLAEGPSVTAQLWAGYRI
jgi:uncharacterized protein (DUF58 family)